MFKLVSGSSHLITHIKLKKKQKHGLIFICPVDKKFLTFSSFIAQKIDKISSNILLKKFSLITWVSSV
jgi:hypothetical protein